MSFYYSVSEFVHKTDKIMPSSVISTEVSDSERSGEISQKFMFYMDKILIKPYYKDIFERFLHARLTPLGRNDGTL